MFTEARTRSHALLAVAAIGVCAAGSANALTIDPIFDSSITALSNAATI
jgi:hypothetical protein